VILCNHYFTTLHDVRNFSMRNLLWYFFGDPFLSIVDAWLRGGGVWVRARVEDRMAYNRYTDTRNSDIFEALSHDFARREKLYSCLAGHFRSHEHVDPMHRSLPFVDQNNAKATFSGSDCFVPLHWGIKITGCIKLRDEVDF
jgi:hypothetical protein